MVNQAILLTICFVVSLIPSAVVAVVLFLRQEAHRGDNAEALTVSRRLTSEMTQVDEALLSLENKLSDAKSEIIEIKQRVRSYEESLTRLSNKWAARVSAERRAENVALRDNEDKETRRGADNELLPPSTPDGGIMPDTIMYPVKQYHPPEPPKRQFGKLG
jgi:uncharacterized protein YfcZ (UPF0381/DUF406 family)